MDKSIFNSQNLYYKSPFGALRAGESVQFTLSVPADFVCTTPYLIVSQDNVEPVMYPLVKSGSRDGRDVFTIEFTPQKRGLYFYYFDLYTDYRKLYCGALGEAYISTGKGELYQLTVYDEDYTVPKGIMGGVMYQIFPDRFYEGVAAKPMPYTDRIYRADKENEPYFWPNEQHEGYLNMDYYGGDFIGIEQKLDYIASLGVTLIYLNPIFEAHSNHRYNTADYMKADPLLGTAEDFAHLCAAAKALGIGIILDGVFSHTGSDSVYFNKEARYPTLGAYQGRDSEYYSWYVFGEQYDHGYRSWWGFETLPEINEAEPSFRAFICGEGGVIDYWLGLGAQGFRLDVADELPDDFIADIRKAVKRGGEDKYLIGEVWDDASNKLSYSERREYLLGKELDSVMNYPFKDAIIAFLRGGDAAHLANVLMHICENYPPCALNVMMNFISTHDTVRGITALAGESCEGKDRYWQSGRRLTRETYMYARRLLRLAYAMVFTLPGIPSIYYGDEICMQGYKDPFNRGYYDWNSAEGYMLPTLRTLAELRSRRACMREGELVIHEASGGFIHYERRGKDGESGVHMLFNRSETLQTRAVNGAIREIGSFRYLIVE